jgi:hypothetical protein
MDYLGYLLISGFSTAFVISLLEYFTANPLIRALSSLITSLISSLIFLGWCLQLIPVSLGGTFLGVLLLSAISALPNFGSAESLKRSGRVPRL